MIRVLLADDEGMIRSALAALLRLEGDIDVVAECADGEQAVAERPTELEDLRILLKEKIERRAIVASLLGLAGVLVIFAGQAEADLGPEAILGSLAVLASACLYAYNIILMRRQAQVARPVEVAFFISGITALTLALGAPVLAEVPAAEHWPWILLGALLAFGSLLLLARAYARAEAQHLAPVEYTSFIWASLLGWFVFGEKVGPFTLAGAALIICACLIAASRRRSRVVPNAVMQAETGIPGGA